MKLRAKLLLALLPLALAVVVLGLAAVATVSSLGLHSQAILQDNYRSVLAAQRMKESLERIADSASMAMITGDFARGARQTAEQRPRFEAELRVEEGNITEVGEEVLAARLRQLWSHHLETLEHFFTAPPDARSFFLTQLEPSFEATRGAADAVLATNQDAMVRKSDRARQEGESMNTVMIAAALAALLIGGILSITATTRLLRPLDLLTRTVKQIGEGDLEARVTIPGRDELSRLANDINAMAQRLDQYRKSSLGELLLAQQSSQAAIDSLPDPVIVFDLAGEVLNVNTAAEDILHLESGGRNVESLRALAPPVWAVIDRARQHVLAGKGPFAAKSFEEAVPLEDADERFVLPRATPVYGEQSGIAGVTVMLQDVTRLRRVDQLRSDLVATVAHEFRTPLTSLRMALHLCLNQAAGPLSEKQMDLLYAAREDCERLQGMVDELLDLARIQSGNAELDRHAMTPGAVVAAAAAAIRTSADTAGIQFSSEVQPGLPAVAVDRERIQLVLSNLLGNAVRHTPAGGHVRLGVRAERGGVRFEVADSGEGIAAEYHRGVFDKFFRVPGSHSGGAGIGLSLAKEIVDAHGGEIGVESTPGRGATFWFRLPALADEDDDLRLRQ